jgi:hypothetical protein
LGYALGDFFVAGPQFSWGTPGVDQFLHLRVPQLVSYLLFFMLTVQPILTAQILTRSLKWLVQRPDAPSKIAAVIIMASLQGVLLYAWTLAAPMVIRILWDWAGATPPVTFTHFSEITSTWLPLAGVVASLARAWLSFRAAPSAAVARNIDALTRAFRQSDERPAPTRRMPIPVRAALSALLVTLFVSGFIATFALGLVIWAFVSGILIARSTILTKHPGWNQWAEFAQQIPLIFRWGAAMTASYLLARSTLALPGQAASINRAAGAFQAELVSLALTLVVCLLLLPATANRETQSTPSSIPRCGKNSAWAIILLLSVTSHIAHATCLDPFCCFGTNENAALAVLGLALLLAALWFLGPEIAVYLLVEDGALASWGRVLFGLGPGLGVMIEGREEIGETLPELLEQQSGSREAMNRSPIEPGAVEGVLPDPELPLPYSKPGWPTVRASDAQTFSWLEPVELPEGTTLYRVVGPENNPSGSYWSLDSPPATEAEWRGGYGVTYNMNSDGSYLQYTVGNGGLNAWVGESAAQRVAGTGDTMILPGGSKQVWLPVDSVTPTSPTPTPWSRP